MDHRGLPFSYVWHCFSVLYNWDNNTYLWKSTHKLPASYTEETKFTVDETDIFHYIGGCIVHNTIHSAKTTSPNDHILTFCNVFNLTNKAHTAGDRQPVTCLLDRGGLTHLKPSRSFLSYRNWKQNAGRSLQVKCAIPKQLAKTGSIICMKIKKIVNIWSRRTVSVFVLGAC